LHAVGHDQADSGALTGAGFNECGGQRPCAFVELGVTDSGRWVDHHRLAATLLGARPQ
jgi:hypothetical protein